MLQPRDVAVQTNVTEARVDLPETCDSPTAPHNSARTSAQQRNCALDHPAARKFLSFGCCRNAPRAFRLWRGLLGIRRGRRHYSTAFHDAVGDNEIGPNFLYYPECSRLSMDITSSLVYSVS